MKCDRIKSIFALTIKGIVEEKGFELVRKMNKSMGIITPCGLNRLSERFLRQD